MSKNARILVAEDDGIAAKGLERSLTSLGYFVPAIAVSGKDAIALAAETHPDLILMDIRLKGTLDGIQAAQKIHDTLSIPVVYVTSYGDDATLERAKPTQPLGFVTKPVDEVQLKRVVELALSKNYFEKRLREEREKFFSLFNDSPVGIALFDHGTKFVQTNKSMCKFLGYSEEELAQLSFLDVTHPDDIEKSRHLKEQLFAGLISKYQIEKRYIKKNGKEVWGNLTASVVRDSNGGALYCIGIIEDITTRKQLDEERETLKEAAETTSRAKSDFLANMSHEIRTPLSVIIGYAQILAESSLGTSTFRDYADRIDRNAGYLLQLINDILDLSKIESGKLDVEKYEVPLLAELSEILRPLRDEAQKKGLSFNVAFAGMMPDTITTDPVRMRQILVNIIGNAIKFTETGTIDITVTMKKHEGLCERLGFLIRDTGVGLTRSQQERLFQPFSQADSSTTRRFGGTGLGLSLARRLAQELGGGIMIVKSTPHQGSTFLITLDPGPMEGVRRLRGPAQAAMFRRKNKQATYLPTVSLSKMQILLVEDAPEVQILMEHVLHSMGGAEVEVAGNGSLALEKARANAYDCILMDIQLPEMDGYEVTKTLRQEGCKTPIIALSARAFTYDRQTGLAAGCNEYVTKPVKPERLLDLLQKYQPVR